MFKISAEVKRLKEFLEDAAQQRPGQQISYMEIEEITGVPMNVKGKGYLRNAAQYVGVEYSAIPKYGIELASAGNGLSIIGGRLARIDAATRRAEKSTKNISSRYFADMDDRDRSAVLFLGSVFGAIRASADSYKLLAATRRHAPQLTNT
jgi:hypothetical protein